MLKIGFKDWFSSCEAFHLTQPYKVRATPLEVLTNSGVIEELVLEIRSTVLSGTWVKSCMKPSSQDVISYIEDEQVIKNTIYDKMKSDEEVGSQSAVFKGKTSSDLFESKFDAEKLAVLLR